MSGLGQGSGGPSQFSMDGSAPSQFTMPDGSQGNFQGTQMLPAVLGGVQGVQDAQDWTKAMQAAGGGLTDVLGALGGAAGQLQAPEAQQMGMGGGGGARGGGGQAVDFNPSQISMMGQSAGQMQGGQGMQNLLQLLQMGNKGFNIR